MVQGEPSSLHAVLVDRCHQKGRFHGSVWGITHFWRAVRAVFGLPLSISIWILTLSPVAILCLYAVLTHRLVLLCWLPPALFAHAVSAPANRLVGCVFFLALGGICIAVGVNSGAAILPLEAIAASFIPLLVFVLSANAKLELMAAMETRLIASAELFGRLHERELVFLREQNFRAES
jgi:hypothetical protein